MNRNRIPGATGSDNGSVTLEFSLMFPLLLILFMLAWDVIFVFNYDILGSYASFAAARSYAVFKDSDLAEGVAVAVMSTATVPETEEKKGKDSGSSDENASGSEKAAPDGVSQFLSFWKGSGMMSGGDGIPPAYKTAAKRMTVSIVPVETSIMLRKGFSYGGGKETQEANWWESFLAYLGLGERSDSVPAQVVYVDLTYSYPVLMGYLRRPSLFNPSGNDAIPVAFKIRNTCASPIEPSASCLEKTTEETGDVMSMDTAEELDKANDNVKAALSSFYGVITGVETYFKGDLKNPQLYTSWDADLGVSPPRALPGAYYSGDKYAAPFTHMREKSFIEMKSVVEKQNGEGGAYVVEGLFDPAQTLSEDIKYRNEVISMIESGLSKLSSERNDCQATIAYEKSQEFPNKSAIDTAKDRISVIDQLRSKWELWQGEQEGMRDISLGKQPSVSTELANVQAALKAYYAKVKTAGTSTLDSMDALLERAQKQR